MDELIKKLGLEDCFVDAPPDERIEISDDDVAILGFEITEDVIKNEHELNRGVEILEHFLFWIRKKTSEPTHWSVGSFVIAICVNLC